MGRYKPSMWDHIWDDAAREQDRERRRKLLSCYPDQQQHINQRVTFGRHQWKTLGDVFIADPTYIPWLASEPGTNWPEGFRESIHWFIATFEDVFARAIKVRNAARRF